MWLTLAATWVLILAGGLVTSTGSGLAVTDWPLSNGTLMPKMVGGVRYEHTHRLIAMTVGLLTIAVAVSFFRAALPSAFRRFGLAAVGLVVLQGVLGGMTVLLKLPAAVSIAHACLAQSFFCVLVSLVILTSPSYAAAAPAPASAAVRRGALWTTGVVFLQLLTGAFLRHTGWGLGGHLSMAGVVSWLLMVQHGRIAAEAGPAGLKTASRATQVLLAVQLMLGVAVGLAFFPRSERVFGWEVGIATLHVGVGAALLAASLAVAWWSWRPERFALPAAAAS